MHLSDVAGTSARSSKPNLLYLDARKSGRPKSKTLSAGFSLIEMLVSIAIILIVLTMSIPFLNNNRRSYHLSQATAAVSGAIQAARYQAIMNGCSYHITFTAATTTYQVQRLPLKNTLVCDTTWQNVPPGLGPTPWAFSKDVSMSPTTTLQFSPNGTVAATAGTTTFKLSNGYTTNTITVSGVGNVKVTNP